MELITLTNYNAMIETAIKIGDIHPDDEETLKEWREDPETWTPKK